jgi:hypothetical protein
MMNNKFSNPVFILLHYFEKKSQIYFRSAEKRRLLFEPLLTGIRSHSNILLLLYIETSACNAGVRYKEPCTNKPHDSDQFNSGFARLKICIL